MEVLLIRHGETKGNLDRKYIGSTEEPLCPQGIKTIKSMVSCYPKMDLLFVSPKIRCRETANILFPYQKITICDPLKECDFGSFENKNYLELSKEPLYETWLSYHGQMDFPKGEKVSEFKNRCQKYFLGKMEEYKDKNMAFVIHGGSIMAIMEAFALPKAEFYHWKINNGEGFLCQWSKEKQCLYDVVKIERRESVL